jgi:phosphoglycolate phosphatase
MYEALVFDLDGTLLDTLDDISSCLNQALAEHQLPQHSPSAIRTMVGYGLGELVRKAAPTLNPEAHTQVLARFRHLYLEQGTTHTVPYPGINELLTELHNQGVLLAVLTNKVHSAAVRIVEHYFPQRFAAIQGEEVGLERKPHPAGLHKLIDQLSARGLETAMVGDSEADIITARSAGIPAIGVSWGFRDASVLHEHGAITVCHTIQDLRFVLGLD